MNGGRGVFLDRDGTILELVPYLHDPDQVRLLPGAAESLRRLGEAGWARVLVTNQSGVARGYYPIGDVERVHARLLALLRSEGADLEAIEICPHHPEHSGACRCRKPAPGMLEAAAVRIGIDTRRSWTVGDRMEDLEAGSPLGCRGILVLTGYGREQARGGLPSVWVNVDYVAWDLPAAVAHILGAPDSRRR